MADIGKLSLKLVADASGLYGVLGGVEKRFNSLKKVLETPIKSFAGGVLGPLSNMFSGAFKLATNPLGPIEDAFKGFFALTGEGSKIKEIADIGKAAQRAGLDASDFVTFMAKGKMEAGDLTRVLAHATNAVHNQGKALDASRKPLEDMGLDLGKLQKLEGAGFIDELADQFKGLNAVQQAGVAQALGGRKFDDLKRLLAGGSGGIAKFKEGFMESGAGFTSADAQRAIAAADSMKILKTSFEGVKTTLTLAFAPVITDIATGIQGWIDKMGGGKEVAKAIANAILDVAEVILDVFEKVEEHFTSISELADKIQGKGWSVGGHLKKGLEYSPAGRLYKLVTGNDIFGSEGAAGGKGIDFGKGRAWIDQLREGAGGLGGAGSPQRYMDPMELKAKNAELLAEKLRDLGKASRAITDKLTDEVAAWGLNSHEVEIAKLQREALDGTIHVNIDSLKESIRTLALEKDRLKAVDEDIKAFADFNKNLEASIQTPFDKWQSAIDGLVENYARLREEAAKAAEEGKSWEAPEVAAEQFKKMALGIQLATDTFQQAATPQIGIAALTQGSSAAISAINADMNRGQQANPLERIADLAREQKATQERISQDVREMLQRANMPVPNIFA